MFLPRLPRSFWPLREEGSPGESVGGGMWGSQMQVRTMTSSLLSGFKSVVQPVSIFLISSFLPTVLYPPPYLSPCGRQGDPRARDPWLSSASCVAVHPGEAQAPIL